MASPGHALRRASATGPVVLVFFLASLGFGSFEVTLAMLNRDILGVSDKKNFLDTLSRHYRAVLVLVLTQGPLYRRLAKYVSEATFIGRRAAA